MSDEAGFDVLAYHRHLREHAPVQEQGGAFQVARYADVRRVLRDHDTFSSAVVTPREGGSPSMLFSDPPLHNRLRKLVSYAFKPSHIDAQQGLVQAKCDELIAAMRRCDEVDLVDALAAPLPVAVIARMLGVEDGDMGEFKRWSDKIFSNIGDVLFASPDESVQRAIAEMDAYFTGRIASLRADPPDNLLGRLLVAETEEGRLGLEELLSFCRLLLIAGNETTTGLITASARVFDEMPETFDALKADPSLVPGFLEETLRYHSPFGLTVRRAVRAAEIAGVSIPEGALVVPLIASANRDAGAFDRPDEVVTERDPNPHLGFGFGIHFCLGAHLARLEGAVAVTALVREFAGIEICGGGETMQWGRLGGPATLPVRLRRAA